MATISSDVLVGYAADAALEVEGVRRLVESTLHRHKGVRLVNEDGKLRVELHIAVDWGASIPAVGATVQRSVSEYLNRMADLDAVLVDVVVDEIEPP